MFSAFTVKNFRCFRALRVGSLGRFNLIAGKNNSGKTALLEALHLHCCADDPEAWIDVNKWRGIDDPPQAFEELSNWLFFDRDSSAPVEAASTDDQEIERRTSLWFVERESSRERFPELEEKLIEAFGVSIAGSRQPRLILEYHDETPQVYRSVATLTPSGRASFTVKIPWKIPNILLPSTVFDSDRDVKHLGNLETSKRLADIIPSLQVLEPRLQRLSLAPLAGETVIHGDIVGLTRLLPVALIGEGMRRLLSIVLAIANNAGGSVFIDEIENGIHYSALTRMWQGIADAARRDNVQIFATTHSWECLRAAQEAFSRDSFDDFRLHRLDQIHAETEVVTYDREMIDSSLAAGLELR